MDFQNHPINDFINAPDINVEAYEAIRMIGGFMLENIFYTKVSKY